MFAHRSSARDDLETRPRATRTRRSAMSGTTSTKPDTWGRAQYAAGHIPGAIFVHLDTDLSAPKTGTNGRHPLPTPEARGGDFGRLGIARGKQVVAYDQGGGAYAARLWWMLRWLGFEAWPCSTAATPSGPREGRVVSTDADRAARRRRSTSRSVTPTVDATGVMASIPRQRLLIVDARAPERFRGENEPLDPGGRTHPGRPQPSAHAQSRRRRHVQASGVPARGVRRVARRHAARRRSCTSADRASPRATTSSRWRFAGMRGHAAVSGIVERVVRRSGAARGSRRLGPHARGNSKNAARCPKGAQSVARERPFATDGPLAWRYSGTRNVHSASVV